MSEQKDRHDGNGPADASEGSRDDAVARRDFIRKSAEVAAFSMFGVAGLDALVERVIGEVGRLAGDEQMAHEASEILAEAGITARADAQCPEWEVPCAESGDYNPNCLVPTPHECGEQHQKFVVNPCFPKSPFVCGPNETPKYGYCPEDCQDDDHKCMGHFLEHHFACPASHECPGDFGFACGSIYQTPGHFDCNSKFVCGNGDGIYDFHCTGSFDCRNDFDCDAYHIFQCLTYVGTGGDTGFECEGQGGFECDAGGAACGATGSGGYDVAGGAGRQGNPRRLLLRQRGP